MKLRTGSIIEIVFCVIIFSVTLSCSDSEPRIGLLGQMDLLGQNAIVNINLGQQSGSPQASNNSILNIIRSIFISDAMAQTAPAAFGSVDVTVTAAGMTTIQQTFPGTGDITVTVPAGASRLFTVTAYTATGDPSAALSFRGTATMDLTAGATVYLPVTMSVNTTKIVIPDTGPTGSLNLRIVQIENMSNTGWTSKTGPNIGFAGSNFRPWDIAFDARGRIYIATNGFSTGDCKVVRINNINDTACFSVADNGITGIIAVEIDRSKNYVYYASSSALRRCNTDGTGNTPMTINAGVAPIVSILGLSIDASGILYVSGTTTGPQPRVFRYDPTSQQVTHVYLTNLGTPVEDVLFKSPYVYVANPNGANNYKIIQLDTNLQYVASYGIAATTFPSNTKGEFYGPRRFLAIRNDVLIMIDEASGTSNFDKLVSMQDILGTGWTNYGQYGTTASGPGYFGFFYGC